MVSWRIQSSPASILRRERAGLWPSSGCPCLGHRSKGHHRQRVCSALGWVLRWLRLAFVRGLLSHNQEWLTRTAVWVEGKQECTYACAHTHTHTHISLYPAIGWQWSRKSGQQAGTGQCRRAQLLGHQPAAALPSQAGKPGKVIPLGSSSPPVLAFS